jgi:hypothetical protein
LKKAGSAIISDPFFVHRCLTAVQLQSAPGGALVQLLDTEGLPSTPDCQPSNERRAYLQAIREALAGVEKARVVLAGAKYRMENDSRTGA